MKVPVGLELAALDSTDMPTVRAWRNDYRVWRWCRQNDLISDVEQAGWYERQTKDQSVRMYKIMLQSGGQPVPVGVCGLTSLDWQNRRAEFSLYIDPARQRQGLGKQALSILLLHAFGNLGLLQVWGESFDGNPALKMFEALGFKKDGTRRQFYFKDGKYHDAHLVSILHTDWLSRQQPLPQSRGDSLEHRRGNPVPCADATITPPPPKSVAGATSQTRIRRAQKDEGGKSGRSISLVERAGITGPGQTGETIDI